MPGELSEWYELVEGRDLQQGDILEACPIFVVPADLEHPPPEDAQVEVGTQDVIVTSQSCDLVEGQKKNVAYVTLAPVWSLSEMEAVSGFLASPYGKETCRRGNMFGYHMLAACEHEEWSRDIRVVSFRELHSLPIDFLRAFANHAGGRLRILSPYREHLAQAFARSFMRVGLPTDIPNFSTEDDEKRAFERLDALDLDGRERVIRALRDQ